jgi:hypothetical protein
MFIFGLKTTKKKCVIELGNETKLFKNKETFPYDGDIWSNKKNSIFFVEE